MLGKDLGGCGTAVLGAITLLVVVSTCTSIVGENSGSSAPSVSAEDRHAKKVQAMCGSETDMMVTNLTKPFGNVIMKIDKDNSVVQVGRGWYLSGIDDKKNLAKVLAVCYSKNEAFSFVDWRSGKEVASYNALFHLSIKE